MTYKMVGEDITKASALPSRNYFLILGFFASGILCLLVAWMYQIELGMVVAGINHPVGWGVYIANFVFWVGIAHSGTLISAILFLVRSRWRDSVSRSAEAMTVFAVMSAGLYPLIHLGRIVVFYYILPYPSQRQLWPNFMSPLVWDVVAVSTYFTVSSIFFYIGLIPDLASFRDRYEKTLGRMHPRVILYRVLSLGWSGSATQWQHYGRGYLFFAALATPLVVSVHSVVSWDFAVGILPGWHTTIFAPYFVAGAIHSGLAMVITLVIPMRRVLGLEKLITVKHLDAVAKTIIVTTLIVGYAYAIEPFIGWFSGDIFERQFALWRAVGHMKLSYWLLLPLNVLFPLLFIFKRIRTNLKALFIISILINIGMWLERYFIVTASTAHDFLPHNWGKYTPSAVEIVITLGVFCFFFFFFFIFAKIFPTIPESDMKDHIAHKELEGVGDIRTTVATKSDYHGNKKILFVFDGPAKLIRAAKAFMDAGFSKIETFSPIKLSQLEQVLRLKESPVKYWTLLGAMAGFAGGFALTIGTAKVNSLIVGAKPPVSIIPYFIVAFEGTILLGTLANFLAVLFYCKLRKFKPPKGYDARFSDDKFGLLLSISQSGVDRAKELIKDEAPEEINEIA